MTIKNEDLARKFAHGATSGTGSNMFIEGNKIYSYGKHFIIGIRRNDYLFVLNGETYSPSTSKQQSYVREICKSQITIPFDALRQAIGEWDLEAHVNEMKIIDQKDVQYREVPYIDPKTDEYKIRMEHMLGAVLFSFRDKYFLSGTDDRAKGFRLGYFMVELPKKVKSIEDAIISLRPRQINENTPHERQGEFFFVPTKLKDKDLQDTESGRDEINTYFEQTKTSRNNHTANKLKQDKKGNIYVRGRITHPEHKSVLLGEVWHRVYINRAKRSIGSFGRID